MPTQDIFRVSRNYPHYEGESVFFDKSTGRHYTVDDDGTLVPTKNPLTDPNYVPIDYAGFNGQNGGDYIDLTQ